MNPKELPGDATIGVISVDLGHRPDLIRTLRSPSGHENGESQKERLNRTAKEVYQKWSPLVEKILLLKSDNGMTVKNIGSVIETIKQFIGQSGYLKKIARARGGLHKALMIQSMSGLMDWLEATKNRNITSNSSKVIEYINIFENRIKLRGDIVEEFDDGDGE